MDRVSGLALIWPGSLIAVQDGKPHVHQYQVWFLGCSHGYACTTVPRLYNLIARASQPLDPLTADVLPVFYDENLGHTYLSPQTCIT